MTTYFPPRDDLLATVGAFLLSVRGALTPELRYQAQVAAYLLDIVRREEAAPQAAAMIRDLAAFRDAVRAGRLDDQDATLAEALLAETVAEVRIVRPDQLDPIHREDTA